MQKLRKTWRQFLHKLDRAWWYTRGVLWDRYNVIHVRTLPPTWVDRDELMLHANFEILRFFVEDEKAFECHVDWSATPQHSDACAQMLDLYDWWKNRRPARVEPIFQVPEHLRPSSHPDPLAWLNDKSLRSPEWNAACEEQIRLEDEWEAEDQRNLHRLIDLRKWMWT